MRTMPNAIPVNPVTYLQLSQSVKLIFLLFLAALSIEDLRPRMTSHPLSRLWPGKEIHKLRHPSSTLSPGQTRKHCCGNILSCRCFIMFPTVGKLENIF